MVFALLYFSTAFAWRRTHRRSWRLLRCSSNPQNAKSSPLPVQNEWIAVYCCNRFKKPPCTPLTKVQQTLINWTSPKSKSRLVETKMLANPVERQQNHWNPLTKVRGLEPKKVGAKKAVHTNLILMYCKVTNFRTVPIFVPLTWNWFARTNFRTFEGLKV